MFNFDIVHSSTVSQARRGKIVTPHGIVETPAFVTVGTKATIKSLAPEDLECTKTQLIFGNTYHLVLSPATDLIKKAGGIHKLSGINKPFITDSGGFQVFSLAFQDRKNMYQLNIDLFITYQLSIILTVIHLIFHHQIFITLGFLIN
jgi:queuine tRNA-ribosyltransferase